jgi:hypothetical protein
MTTTITRFASAAPRFTTAVGSAGYTGFQSKNRRCTHHAASATRAVNASTASAFPAVTGPEIRYSSANSTSSAFGTCSRKFPLVESGFSSTSRQNRTKLVFGAPVLRW